jgi:hypothetical protein
MYLDESDVPFARNIVGDQRVFRAKYFNPSFENTMVSSTNTLLNPSDQMKMRVTDLFPHSDYIQNINILRLYMSEYWTLNDLVKSYIRREMAKVPMLRQPLQSFVTVVVRGGDKVTLEKQEIPHMRHIAAKIKAKNASRVHLIIDTYSMYQELVELLPEVQIFTTFKSYENGFFIKDMANWTDQRMEHEVLTTLFNYEVARLASDTIMPSHTSIAVWIALLRMVDCKQFSFVKNNSYTFPYFGFVLPLALDGDACLHKLLMPKVDRELEVIV